MTVYSTTRQMIQNLSSMDGVLDKLAAHADRKKTDSKNLIEARLIADQFPFKKQIQIATDTAKAMAGRLSQKDMPVFEDTEQTVAELKNRIQKTITYLKTFKEDDFKNYEGLKIPINFLPGKYLTGKEYYEQMSIPNFFFHLTTAYSILRANGVDLGKSDYLGNLDFKNL